MTGICHLPATASVDEILAILDRDAGVILDNVMHPDSLEKLRSEISPYLNSCETGRDEFGGFKTKRVGALVARSEVCADLVMHDTVLKVAERFLEPYCDSIQLNFTQAIEIGPGQGYQAIHRDRGIWGKYLNRSIEPVLGTIWAMTDFAKENGATQFVPGSHRWEAGRQPTEDEIQFAEMKAGSVLLYTGTVLHGGGKNETANQYRTGVLLHYSLSWIRQEENQYLSCPPEIAAGLDPKLRALMGYSKGGYVLGFYSEPTQDGNAVIELAPPEVKFGDKARIDKAPNSAELISTSTR